MQWAGYDQKRPPGYGPWLEQDLNLYLRLAAGM
jgi:hypothetical protein